jgi:hypothetical protein
VPVKKSGCTRQPISDNPIEHDAYIIRQYRVVRVPHTKANPADFNRYIEYSLYHHPICSSCGLQ